MATNDPRGLSTVASLVMVAILAVDFIWVIRTALHARHSTATPPARVRQATGRANDSR